MTFPTAVKKTGPLTISKTGSGSKTLSPGSPRSPGSPLNAPAKTILPGSSKAPLASKGAEKVNAGSAVKKPSVSLKSSTVKSVTKSVIDAKLEPEKSLASAAKGVTRSVTKPPPLTIKVMDAKGLQSPKTPTISSIKSQTLTKSPMATKPSVSKSTLVPTGIVRSPSINKTVSSPMAKSPQVKSTLTSKSLAASSPVAKSPPTSVISKTSTTNSAGPKSPTGLTNHSTLVAKPVTSTAIKVSATVAKPTTPVKKTAILSAKSSPGVKSPTIPFNKPSIITKSPSASSMKSISLKTPNSPSKLLTKEPPSSAKISSLKSTKNSNEISKSNPTSSKAIVKKESSSLSLLSTKSSSTIKSTTSAVSKTSTLKVSVTPLSSSVTKNLVPKSPVAKTKPLAVVKIPSSPTVRTPLSSMAKTPSSPIVKSSSSLASKAKTPQSPTMKTRSPSLSLVKPPLSPAVKKMVPTKLILSPGPSKSRPLSSSKLNSVSTESLASRTSLKSPMTPRSTKVVTKSPSKIIKKIEEPKAKGIRGGQPIRKTIEIPGITELPSNLVLNQQETLKFDFVFENAVENVLKEEIESTITQIPDQDSSELEKLESTEVFENIDDGLCLANDLVNDESAPSNIADAENICLSPEVRDHNLETIEEDSIEPSTAMPSLNDQKQEDVCILSDFEVVKKDECIPQLNSISHSDNNCNIAFDDNHFNVTNENVTVEQLDETQSCIIDIDDHFEPMNDKLVLGDVPFETDSSQDEISDNEQPIQKEVIKNENCGAEQNECIDDVFTFTDNLSMNNFDSADSTENFIHQFMPKSIERPEGSLSISTDDESLLSRKSYSEAVSGSPKDCEYYFDYDFEMVDDCLEYDDEGRSSVFVEVTEKEFPELKPKDLSGKRRRNKKQKKRNYSNRSESLSGKYYFYFT